MNTDDLHQSALEQHIVLSLASEQLLRTVCNLVSPVVTTRNLLKCIDKQLHLMFARLFWKKCVTKKMIHPCFVISNHSNNCITAWNLKLNLLRIHLSVEGRRGRGRSCVNRSGMRFNTSNYIYQQSGLSRQSQCVSC